MSQVAAKPVVNPTLPLVAIVGATGTGKSDAALDLAEDLIAMGHPAQIVNADAMQLYRGMDIGTAKLPESKRRGIPHHLLDIWDVTREASVADYQVLARAVIRDLLSKGVIPILVGGSGLYVSAVLYEFEFPGTDKKIREELENKLATDGLDSLLVELGEKDPLAAAAIDPKNIRRVIRALEVIRLTGKPFGAGLDAEHRRWRENLVVLGLEVDREDLVKRLDLRVAQMWASGLVREASNLIPLGIENGITASRAIGYQQALSQLAGDLPEADAIEETQALTRRYARRQVSWFRRNQDTLWIDPGASNARAECLSSVLSHLNEQGSP
jgi:tRNA dimethylallyltransferase